MEKPTDTAIRPLHETELPAASALAGRVFAEFEAPEYSPEGIGTFLRFVAPEALAAQHRNGSMQSWGAFRRGRLVGIIALTRRSHLCLLFVEKACHRQGIARALFSTLRDHCRTAPDTPRITVNSSPYAVGAYRRLGFRATGDERTVDGIRFTPMEYLFIEKRSGLRSEPASKYLPEMHPAYFAGAGAGVVAVESAGAGSS